VFSTSVRGKCTMRDLCFHFMALLTLHAVYIATNNFSVHYPFCTPIYSYIYIYIYILLHVHPLLDNVLVNNFPRRTILVNSSLLGYATIEDAVFSMSSAPSNSRTVLCNPFLSNGTVNPCTIIGVFRGVFAECL
jgi:hypothetical protein